jgi:hypothetical protein
MATTEGVAVETEEEEACARCGARPADFISEIDAEEGETAALLCAACAARLKRDWEDRELARKAREQAAFNRQEDAVLARGAALFGPGWLEEKP